MGVFNFIFGKKSRKTKKFSTKWFRTTSDKELYREREKVRRAYMKGNRKAEALLFKFNDAEINRMNAKYGKKHPKQKPIRREHGWYLPDKD